MISNVLFSFLFAVLLSAASVVVVSAQSIGWKDSYSIDGGCYCETTFDHNIGGVMVPGPSGGMITVREACALVGQGPQGNRLYYNDVQCGNGPANDAGDEDPDQCPGRVDMGTGNKAGCFEKGPKWQFPGGQDTGEQEQMPVVESTQEEQPEEATAVIVEETETAEQFLVSGGGVLTGLSVTDMSTVSGANRGDTKPLGDTIVIDEYPAGFNIRADVTDAGLVNTVVFSSSGLGRTEGTSYYDMFGSKGSWPNPPKGMNAVVTVTANLKDGTSETIEANIAFV